MRKIFTLLPLTAALLLTGCVSLAPDYERPQAPVEEAWPQDEAVKNAKLLTEGLADWASFFTDARLTKLIEQGLAQNRSLRSAFYSVEEARAQYGVSRAELFPSVAAAAGESAARSVSRTGSSINRTYSATAMASYELDLFGRVRNLNEMALQAFFQTQAAHRADDGDYRHCTDVARAGRLQAAVQACEGNAHKPGRKLPAHCQKLRARGLKPA